MASSVARPRALLLLSALVALAEVGGAPPAEMECVGDQCKVPDDYAGAPPAPDFAVRDADADAEAAELEEFNRVEEAAAAKASATGAAAPEPAAAAEMAQLAPVATHYAIREELRSRHWWSSLISTPQGENDAHCTLHITNRRSCCCPCASLNMVRWCASQSNAR